MSGGGILSTSTPATFLNRPISIETDEAPHQQNWSRLTITTQVNDPGYRIGLKDCVDGLRDWVTQHLKRKANCTIENNQVVCTMNIGHEYLAEDVIPELRNQLSNYQGRTMATTAGRGGGTDGATGRTDKELRGETGEEAYEEIRGT